jgi:monoamine oxidase
MDIFDVAVIGAGVSGAYTAWRLQEHYRSRGRPNAVALFEYSDRVGGRLYSRTLPGMPHVWAELGGMRYIPGDQALVSGLIEELGLPSRPFPMGNPDPAIGSDRNFIYVRQRHLLAGDLTRSDKVPYHVRWAERNMGPSDLQTYVMNWLAPDAAKLSWEQMVEFQAFGKELYRWGYWNLLYRVLSSEACAFMKDTGGYDTALANSNSAYTLRNIHGPTQEYRTLVNGYDKLPIELVARYRRGRGRFVPNHRLVSFGRASERQPYELVFTRTRTRHGETSDAAGAEVRLRARSIILAMPRRSLERIAWEGFGKEPLREGIRSVLREPAFKLFHAYERPWWRQLGLVAGRSITDLPLRQCYYFLTEGEQEGADPNNQSSLLMGTYNDAGSVGFWKGFEKEAAAEPYRGYRTGWHDPEVEATADPRRLVSTDLVRMAQQQLEELHGQQDLPEPYAARFHDWSHEPYGAGWHVWKAGFRFPEVMKMMRRPYRDEAVHICGEAYSVTQGWVEGALQTAERMLEEHFGLLRPGWAPADYDLGP